MKPAPRVYICIPVYNRLDYTVRCIGSIRAQNYRDYTVVICDDGSSDGTAEHIAAHYPEVVITKGDGNLWWAGATNRCVEYALQHAGPDDYIFTLNNDTELEATTLEKLVEFAGRHRDAIVGAVNVFFSSPDKIEPSAFRAANGGLFDRMPRRLSEWGETLDKSREYDEADALAGKGVLIPVSVFRKTGLYNAGKLPHYHADTEFTLRARRAGFRVFILYTAKVLSHQELSGLGTRTSKPDIREFLKSFSSIRSANHIRSMKNFCDEVYGMSSALYFPVYLLKPVLGFVRRFFLYKFGFRK